MKRISGLLFLAFILLINSVSAQDSALCEKGVVNLKSYRLQQDPPVKLSGEWLFLWKKLVGEQELKEVGKYTEVPGNWTSYNSDASFFNKGFGYATYGLTILLPKAGQNLALLLPPLPSAYRLFVDGEPVAAMGKVDTGSNMIPKSVSKVVYFTAKSDKAFLLLQLSNYHFSSSGMWSPITLGSPEQMNDIRDKSFIADAFLVGSLLIMGLYHLAIFAMRRKEKAALFFAILCLALALRACFSMTPLLFYFMPEFSYSLGLKILYTLFPICLLGFVYFLTSTELVRFPLFMKRMFLVVGLGYTGLVWLSPNPIYGNLLIVVIIMAVCMGCFTVYFLIKHLRENPLDNALLLLGILACFIGLLNDSLYEAKLINTGFLLPFAFLILLLLQAIVLSLRFTGALSGSERLATELATSNVAYEQMVLGRREAEEQIEIESLKSKFFSNITHEFKTPLSLITAPTEYLLRVSTDSKEKNLLNTVYRNASHLLRLVNQMMDLSKSNAGKMTKTEMVGDIKEFSHELLLSFQPLASSKNIKLKFVEEDVPDNYCLFDGDKLEKILNNLLSNAIKFTSDGGNVILKVNFKQLDRKNCFQLTLLDSGIGMSDETQANLFKPFYQDSETSFLNPNGTGLGLSYTKELVTLLNGTIQVESKQGIGSSFTIILPVELIEESESENRSDISETSTLLTVTEDERPSDLPAILIIDDHSGLAEYIANFFRPYYEVNTCADGEQAWSIIQQDLPDIVISDIMLPGKDGYEIAGLIRNSPLTSHIGIILLSAKSTIDSRLKGLDMGANDYLTKPFLLSELKFRVDNQIKYQRTLQEYYHKHVFAANEFKTEDITHPFLVKLYGILDQYLDHSDFSIADLADKLAMSSRTLNRKLNSLTKMASSELIRNYRLKKAATFLTTGFSVSEAAYMSGFENVSYFGQCFKEQYRITPSEFIKQTRTVNY
ncbi:response regulator [Pedobacter foliorum]|uniref:response regulator n=1 Tax=Pedobacter foliorum TaxID=2739058 RepID=UPI0015664E63|nr:response regulator [Pedobacter foliorum]NRF40471.1 response regulator [Pedobacter foliorum]